MPRITLYRNADGSGWVADMSQSAHAERTRALFATDQLPTAYTDRADWQYVRDCVQRLNPDHEVLVDILSRGASDA